MLLKAKGKQFQKIRKLSEQAGVEKESLKSPMYQSTVERVQIEYQHQAKKGNLEAKNQFQSSS